MEDPATTMVISYVLVDWVLDDEDEEMDHDTFFTDATLLRDDREKSHAFFEETVNRYLPDVYKRFFKMTADTIEQLTLLLGNCPELAIRLHPGGRPPVPIEKKVLMSLRYFASKQSLFELSDRFDVTEYTLLKCRRQVVTALNRLMPRYVHWPKGEDLQEISQNFQDMGRHNFPNVIGAIDGCHIPIEAPHVNPTAYYNRKKFHSIILQAVCDSSLQFTDINVGWPGRVHDAKVFRSSTLFDHGFSKCRNAQYHIIGDSAYPIKEWLLTPFRNNGDLTAVQRRFNIALSSRRQTIERAFGQLKGRFPRLKYLHNKFVKDSCKIIVACCVLHNICIAEGDVLQDFPDECDDEDHVENPPIVHENDVRGQLKRLALANQL